MIEDELKTRYVIIKLQGKQFYWCSPCQAGHENAEKISGVPELLCGNSYHQGNRGCPDCEQLNIMLGKLPEIS